ncbi:MAG: halocyanin domain-containing protein [Halobacteriaceae archaeon]
MTAGDQRRLTRRALLGAGGAAALGSGGAAAQAGGDGGTASTPPRPDFGSWLMHEGAPVDGGFVDARGQSSVTVEVGAQGNGGTFAFSPASLWIDPGTTVTFEWVSNTHNVMVESQPGGAGWQGHSTIENTGFSFSTTFETSGMFEYYCEPHRPLGMKGGIAVGDDVPTYTPTPAGAGGGGGFTLPGGSLGQAFLALFWAAVGAGALVALGGEAVRARR